MAVDRRVQPAEQEPDFSDDDMEMPDDETLLPDIMNKKPRFDLGLDRVVVVDNLPDVPVEKKQKLIDVFMKKMGEEKVAGIGEHQMPETGDGKTKGFMFIDFADDEAARHCIQTMNGFKFDKHHKLRCFSFSDFALLQEAPLKQFIPPKQENYSDPGDLLSHLRREDAVDQALIANVKANLTLNAEVKWVGAKEFQTVEGGEMKAIDSVQWSPAGTYLATLGPDGVTMRGGADMKKLARIPHAGCREFAFSPCDRFIITFKPTSSEKSSIIIWNIRPVRQMRDFRHEGARTPFRWSHDGEFFARALSDRLVVYETNTFALLDKKAIEVPGLRDFRWSPAGPLLITWCAEIEEAPAKFKVIKMPEKTEMRFFNLYNVIGCHINWQPTGSYACIKVERFQKAKLEEDGTMKYTSRHASLQLLHVREKNIPVEQIELKEHVTAIEFEPGGDRFAFITEQPNGSTVHFYKMVAGGSYELIGKLPERSANTLFWSPAGQYLVIADIKPPDGKESLRVATGSGPLEFVDTSDVTSLNKPHHHACTNVEWDPTGRYVATLTSALRNIKTDNEWRLYTCTGRQLRTLKEPEGLAIYLWRPRSNDLLTADQIKDVKKSQKKYAVDFELQDRERGTKASAELLGNRQRDLLLFKEFIKSMVQLKADYDDGEDYSAEPVDGAKETVIQERLVEMEMGIVAE